jgi:hypothetical protein
MEQSKEIKQKNDDVKKALEDVKKAEFMVKEDMAKGHTIVSDKKMESESKKLEDMVKKALRELYTSQ